MTTTQNAPEQARDRATGQPTPTPDVHDAAAVDRVLDARVAINVLEVPTRNGWSGVGRMIKGDPIWMNPRNSPVTVPEYTRDPRATAHVRVEMRERGWRFAVREVELADGGVHSVVSFSKGAVEGHAADESLERATCLAAVEALLRAQLDQSRIHAESMLARGLMQNKDGVYVRRPRRGAIAR